MALDHIGFDSKDYDEAVKFYEIVLKPLGGKKKMEIINDCFRAAGFGNQQPSFWIHGPPKGASSTRSSGPLHIAFAASSRKQVDLFYAAAINAGDFKSLREGSLIFY